MALKTHIRSIRFSDEIIELINQQIGENFSDKFNRLVYNCYMLSSEKEKEIQRLDEEIRRKKDLIEMLRKDFVDYSGRAQQISLHLHRLYDELDLAEFDDYM